MRYLILILLVLTLVSCSNPIGQETEILRLSGVLSELDYSYVMLDQHYFGGYLIETGIELSKVIFILNLITPENVIRPGIWMLDTELFIFDSDYDPNTEYILIITKEK